jgi:hypothetical protein
MTSPDVARVQLGVEVSAKVYDDLKNVAVDKYGETSGNVGRVVERALEEFLGTDRYDRVEDRLDDLLDRGDIEVATGSAKETEIESRIRDGKTVQVGARVRPEMKERAKEQAREWDVPLYDLVTRAFREYVHGGRADRLLDKLDRLEEGIDEMAEDDGEDESKSTAERIADRVGDQFTVDDFQEATTAEGVTTEKYAVQEYLRDVLEITETGPHPENPSLFVSKDKLPDHRDPSNLPYHAMTDAQKREAIKIDGIRQAVDSRSNLTRYTATDAVETLDGRPRATTVRPLMRDVAEESPENGFEYKPNESVLIVDPEQAQFADYDNENALSVLGLIDEGDGAEERIEMDPPDPTPSTSPGATPARTDGGDPDADKEALKAEADDRLAVLTGAVSDA